METLLAVLTCAALFAVWGLVARHGRASPGCGGCTSACHVKEAPHEPR